MTLYDVLVSVHIFSAILGMGPGFILTLIVTKSTNMSELKHAYSIRHRIHIIVMIGGTLLLITGLWLGILRPYMFSEGWYVISLVLFLVALAFGPFVLSPRSRPIKQLLKEQNGEEIPKLYYTLSKKLFVFEHIENLIFLTIIILMLTKPF
ncbi:MAG: DUF2269 domain-containing protein [Candidatus Pristimantibacillus lignocellulolyticus]|uniref:DUF2269 domain-containing protein n=1 Tax=Candidatus Pristimantibacillus lignocellulolyticus TaxID=2994561 RepID=A0A9J6ZFA5_9BACL|nr:MAG: DUF2269 domain-containing protein [Candidatus Pristimantibacillus lignocellulolyticus]